jgi:hypothetical protein
MYCYLILTNSPINRIRKLKGRIIRQEKTDYPNASYISNTISYTVSYQSDSDSDRIVVGCEKSLTVSYKNGFGNGFGRKLS